MTLPPDPPRLSDLKIGKPVPRPPEADAAAASAYAAVQLLAQALEKGHASDAKGKVDGRKVAEALRAGKFRTILGDVSFDQRGDPGGGLVTLRVWRRTPDGRLDYAGQEPPS